MSRGVSETFLTKSSRKKGLVVPIDDVTSSRIGARLKSTFNDVVNEPVPDRFLELLERLETADKTNDAKASGRTKNARK